jgi:SAM-dependent methyltransferase
MSALISAVELDTGKVVHVGHLILATIGAWVVGGIVLVIGAVAPIAAQHQPEHITPTAEKLNESFGADSAQWVTGFESEGRAIFDKRFEVLDALGLEPGMDVADIGAGSGLYSRLIAERVGPSGQVFAVDIAANLVNHITETATAMGLGNVRAIVGGDKSPRLLEQSVDLVFIADSYHHFEYPGEMLQRIKKALRPDGRLILIDWERIEGVSHPFILAMVRAGKAIFIDEFEAAGFEFVEEIPIFTEEYMLEFRHR